jgi:hypothetical protein
MISGDEKSIIVENPQIQDFLDPDPTGSSEK